MAVMSMQRVARARPSIRSKAVQPRRSSILCRARKVKVPDPIRVPEIPPSQFGFTQNAERQNSRAAMIGFFALLAVEAIFNKGILDLMGIKTGMGIDLPL